MLIAALLAIVLILSIFVVSLYVRWKRVTKRFTHAVGPTRKQSHSSLERVVTVTHWIRHNIHHQKFWKFEIFGNFEVFENLKFLRVWNFWKFLNYKMVWQEARRRHRRQKLWNHISSIIFIVRMNVEDDFAIYTAHRRNILFGSYSMSHTVWLILLTLTKGQL